MGGSGNLPVGPGIWGFIAFFVLAVALWFLVRNMNSRLRRMAYRDRDEAEQPGQPGQPGTADADGTPVTGDDEDVEGSRPHIDRRAVEEESRHHDDAGGQGPRS
ncbi:hypothetical protein [Terrabacter sp. NPDC080008]|uniref:hypothetical protein n=1 Tax=Terrabacter sp. NPDC080008 TaxID=3155176 RepID=UPI00345083B4